MDEKIITVEDPRVQTLAKLTGLHPVAVLEFAEYVAEEHGHSLDESLDEGMQRFNAS